jgi:hypothetical protein
VARNRIVDDHLPHQPRQATKACFQVDRLDRSEDPDRRRQAQYERSTSTTVRNVSASTR